jgi:hypothetical protein
MKFDLSSLPVHLDSKCYHCNHVITKRCKPEKCKTCPSWVGDIKPYNITKWVKCTDQMPDEEQKILIYDKYGIELGLLTDYGSFVGDSRFIEEATHWMPLPSKPL